MANCDPVVESWLRAEFGDSFDEVEADQLNLLALAMRRGARGEITEELLVAWHRILTRSRFTLHQSEVRFIEVAREKGWSEVRIASSLGLNDDVQVSAYYEKCLAELERMHPSQNSQPWSG